MPAYTNLITAPTSIGTGQNKIHYKPGNLAILPGDLSRELAEKKLAEVYSSSDIFHSFHIDRSKPEALFAHMGGGIGDIIQFSALASYLKDIPLIVHCDPKFWPILKMFDREVTVKHFFEPVIHNYKSPAILNAKLCRLSLDSFAIEAGGKNWYDALFSRIGLKKAPEGYGRPRMKQVSEPMLKKTVLICHKSSCQMRTSRFIDFVNPTRNALPDWSIAVSDFDSKGLNVDILNMYGIESFKFTGLQGFFDLLNHASLVISTDTAAIHYREAIGRPALGVYGAFTTESRTKYYKHTHSFNVKSACKYQPCFVHEETKGQLCPLVRDEIRKDESSIDLNTAPCQSGARFREQLYNEIINYTKSLNL